MIVYKVYFKDYRRRNCRLIGILKERRSDLRGLNPLQSGFRWAKASFPEVMKHPQSVLIIPKVDGPWSDYLFFDGFKGKSFRWSQGRSTDKFGIV